MGKDEYRRLPVAQQQSHGIVDSRTFPCQRCPMGLYRRFSLKCAVVLVFSVVAFLSALFSVLPHPDGFDAPEYIKRSATVQAYFKLQKPAPKLVPYTARLEYDINQEIGVPSMKVAVLSMHKDSSSGCTCVVFGFLPSGAMNQVDLSILRSSFVDMFLQQLNLTVTSSIFGEPSSFEILKFPGGITIIPEPDALILQMPQVLFRFSLNSSIYDIKENLLDLKKQLRLGLHLMPNEVVHIYVTNKNGSTTYPPVTVNASVASNLGALQPERLRQLAQTISNTQNLGLNHTVFGEVKEVSLSSFLKHSLHEPAPTPSPLPSPASSPVQMAPSYSPALSRSSHDSLSPCSDCHTSGPSGKKWPSAPSPDTIPSLSPTSDSPTRSVAHCSPHCDSTDPLSPSPTSHPKRRSPISPPFAPQRSPLAGYAPQISPSLSGALERGNNKAFVAGTWRIHWFYSIGLITFGFLFWIS